jgi:hypothetical protein
LFGLNKKSESDEPTIASAASPAAKTSSPPGQLGGVGQPEAVTARKRMYSR